MIGKITGITKLFDANGNHKSYVAKQSNQTVYLYEATIEGKQGQFGSLSKESPFENNLKVDFTEMKTQKGIHFTIKKISTFARNPTVSVMANHNALISAQAATTAIDLLKGHGSLSFTNKETTKKEDGTILFGLNDIENLSLKIATIMYDVQLRLDLKTR